MNTKNNTYTSENDRLYHDTFMLLKNYRDTSWNLELAVRQAKRRFQIEYGSSIDEFLESIYLAGADLQGSELEDYAKSIEKSNKMLSLVTDSVEILRDKHKHGEQYYWILYYTYLSPQQLQNTDEIIEKLEPHMKSMSYRTYYRKRPKAICALGSVLWGFANQDNLRVLERFFPETSMNKG